MLTKQAFDHPSRYENGGIPFVKVDKTNVFELTVSGGTLVIFNTPPGAKIKFVAFKFCGNVIVDTGLTTVPLELIFNVVVCPIAYMVNSNTNRMLKMCFFIFFLVAETPIPLGSWVFDIVIFFHSCKVFVLVLVSRNYCNKSANQIYFR